MRIRSERPVYTMDLKPSKKIWNIVKKKKCEYCRNKKSLTILTCNHKSQESSTIKSQINICEYCGNFSIYEYIDENHFMITHRVLPEVSKCEYSDDIFDKIKPLFENATNDAIDILYYERLRIKDDY
jgi:regulator of sigma D